LFASTLSDAAATMSSVPVSCTVESSQIDLLVNDTVVGHQTMPDLDIAAGEPVALNLCGTFTIVDFAILQSLFNDVLLSSSVKWRLRAKTTAKIFGIPFDDIELSKDVSLAGFGGFSQRSIDAFGIAGTAPNNSGLAVYCNTTLVNPSPVGLTLTDVHLTLLYNATVIGDVVARNFTLASNATQQLDLEGTLSSYDNATTTRVLGALLSSMLAGARPLLTVRGARVGNGTIAWVQGLIGSFALSEPAPPLHDSQPLRNLTFDRVQLDLDPKMYSSALLLRDTAPTPIRCNITVQVTLFLPAQFNFSFELNQVSGIVVDECALVTTRQVEMTLQLGFDPGNGSSLLAVGNMTVRYELVYHRSHVTPTLSDALDECD
jgi:hypothetical protein